jgi:hypothetical protein
MMINRDKIWSNLPTVITVLGAVIIVITLVSDWLWRGYPGFGQQQLLLLMVGIVVIFVGLLLHSNTLQARKSLLPKLARLYTTIALLLLNTLLLFFGLNALIWLSEIANSSPDSDFSVAETQVQSVYDSYAEQLVDFDVFQQIYPDMSDGEVIRLRLESWNVPFICDPHTLYREKPFQGVYITVDPAGFRRVQNQGPWPPNDKAYNVFVFGGSTTFGYGEADEYTIPSFLQQHLRKSWGEKVFVYNFGHASFFSLQERWAFETLVQDGFVPDLAIFIDGLNEFYYWDGQPAAHTCDSPFNLTQKLGHFFTCHDDEWCWPVQRLASRFSALAQKDRTPSNGEVKTEPPVDDAATNLEIIHRWLENKKHIEQVSSNQGIQTLFVMQPVPSYAYNLAYHPFAQNDPDNLVQNSRSKWGYALWEEMATSDGGNSWTANFLNLSHLGEGKREILYLDRVHYSRTFMDEIARNIADAVVTHLGK